MSQADWGRSLSHWPWRLLGLISHTNSIAALLRRQPSLQHHSHSLSQPFGEEATFSPCSNKEFMLIWNSSATLTNQIPQVSFLKTWPQRQHRLKGSAAARKDFVIWALAFELRLLVELFYWLLTTVYLLSKGQMPTKQIIRTLTIETAQITALRMEKNYWTSEKIAIFTKRIILASLLLLLTQLLWNGIF